MKNPQNCGSNLAAFRRRWVLRNRETGHYFSEPYGPDMTEWTPDIQSALQFVTYERASSGAKVFWDLHSIPLSIDELSCHPRQELPSHD